MVSRIAVPKGNSKKIGSQIDAQREQLPEFVGCAEAFEAEFHYLYRTVLRHGVPRDEAEDVVQNVFLTMWRRWGEYDRSRPLRPWLAGIAARMAQGGRRRRREMPVGIPVVASEEATDPEQSLFAAQARALVMAALARLPEKHRTVLIVHALDGLSVTDLARLQEVSIQTASARVRAARKAFARAVTRLINTGTWPRLLLVPSPEALLALERPVPAAPEAVRRRAMLRVAGIRRSPRPELPASPTAPTAVFFAAMVALVATVLWVHRLPPTAARPTTPAVSTSRSLPALLPDRASASGPASALPLPDDVPLRSDAVAYFPLDERPGAVIAPDRSSNRNDCQLRGLDGASSWIPGVRGTALAFGRRGWLECPRVEPLAHLADEITVAAWIRPRSMWGAQTIVSRQKDGGRADDLFFGLVNDRLLVRSRTFRKQLDRPLPHLDGRWIHVAFTRRADGTLTLYAEGAPVGHIRGRPMTIGGGWAPLTIGGSHNGPPGTPADELFAGDIDEVIVFGRALPPEQIAVLSAAAAPR